MIVRIMCCVHCEFIRFLELCCEDEMGGSFDPRVMTHNHCDAHAQSARIMIHNRCSGDTRSTLFAVLSFPCDLCDPCLRCDLDFHPN